MIVFLCLLARVHSLDGSPVLLMLLVVGSISFRFRVFSPAPKRFQINNMIL